MHCICKQLVALQIGTSMQHCCKAKLALSSHEHVVLQAGIFTEYRCKAEAAQVTRLEDGTQRVTDNRCAKALCFVSGQRDGLAQTSTTQWQTVLNQEVRVHVRDSAGLFARQHKGAEQEHTRNRPLGQGVLD